MKEFMFFIRKQSDSNEALSPVQHEKFLRSCEKYISDLKRDGKLISAQPIEWTGKIISRDGDVLNEFSFEANDEVIGGYYHIRAASFEEAVKIAKQNPEFKFNSDTRIEVRSIKMKEETTGFVYPLISN